MTDGVRILEWRAGTPVRPVESLPVALADPDTLVWAHLASADAGRLVAVAQELGLDSRAVEDALTPGERPKTTRHADHVFVTCHASALEKAADSAGAWESRLVLHQISAFVLPHGLLTVCRGWENGVEEVAERLSDRPDLVAAGSAGLIHAVLDTVVDGHFDTVGALDEVTGDLESALFTDSGTPGRSMQEGLYRLHKELVHLRRAVLPLREAVGTLRREFGETGPMAAEFDDLYDHVMRASEWTESLRDTVSAMFETHVSLLDARLNVVMKKLAGWAAVIAIPTAVTGWFGQNVPFPGNGSALGVWVSVLLIVGGTLGAYVLLRRHDWI